MSGKRNKWDEYVQFDDWTSEDDLENEKDNESAVTVESAEPKEIHGIGISRDNEDIDLSDMIAAFNAGNKEYTESFNKEEESVMAQKRAEEERLRSEERAAEAKALYEKERAEKEAREFLRQEEEAKKIAIEMEKKQNRLFNKASKALVSIKGKKPMLKDSGDDNPPEPVPKLKDAVEHPTTHELSKSKNDGIQIMEEHQISAVNTQASHITEIDKTDKSTHLLKHDLGIENINETGDAVNEHGLANQENRDGAIKQTEGKEKTSFFKWPHKKANQDKQDEQGNTGKVDWEYLATHDELTGLYNQRAYQQEKLKKRESPFAVIYVDVNNLKYINDNIGHEAGNEIIIATARQIENLFDEVFRTGGDEFIAIVENISIKKADKVLAKKREDFYTALDKLSRESKINGLVYAASFGYAYSDGSRSYEETATEAENAMYEEKKAYKLANPQYDMRRHLSANKDTEKEKIVEQGNYDEKLSKEQRELKRTIREEHVQVSSKSTMEIIREIQTRSTEIVAILIASPTFDHLFIIQTASTFISVVTESDSIIDFSYLYIMYKDGPVYKGSQEYLVEVTSIFDAIGKGLLTGKIKEEKDLLKIKGINIFKNIYVD